MDGIKSVKEIMAALKKRLWLIILVSLGSGLVSGLYTHYGVTPIYQASSQLLVNKNLVDGQDQVVNVSDLEIRSNIEVINTYSIILKNPVILNEVVEELSLPMSAENLGGRLEVANQKDSQVVTIRVTDANPERAADIVNSTVETFIGKLPELMQVNNVHVLNEAIPNHTPVSPNPQVSVVIAIALGAILGVGLVLLFEFLDTTVRTKADLERLDIKVVGVISNINEKDRMPMSFVESSKADRSVYNVTTTKTEV